MHLVKHEYLIKIPQGNDNGGNQTFTSFTWRTTKPNYKSKQRRHDSEYMKQLKQHMKCFNYGEFGHWSIKCLHRLKKKKYIFLKNDTNVFKTTNLNSFSNGKVCALGLLHEHQSLKGLAILGMVASTQFCEERALGKHHKTAYKIDILK